MTGRVPGIARADRRRRAAAVARLVGHVRDRGRRPAVAGGEGRR
jgi:hypothetical protein